nr:hypothetical protein [Candidatus Njordarchaeota archaeon]
MGLLGFLFNKRFLKLVFIIASVSISLQFIILFASFASGLNWFLQVILATFTLVVFTFFSIRFERFRFLSGLMKFLCFTVVPLILAFSFVLPASIPFPLSAPVKLGTLSLPFATYAAYQKKRWIWKKSPFLSGGGRRYGRLSGDALLPKALEEGHVLYGAGIKGFKVIRFIEVDDQQPDSIDGHVSTETQLRVITAKLSKQLTLMKQYGMEMSYEFYLQNGSLQGFIGLTGEGRNYREVRTRIDEFSRTLAASLRSNDETASAAARPVEDNNRAKRILAMPLSATLEDLKRIENDNYNVKVFTCNDSERPIRLRSIHLSGLPLVNEGNDFSIVDEFAQTALARRSSQNVAYVLHIKALSDHIIDQELARTSNVYQRAMTAFVEEIGNGLFSGKAGNKMRLFKRGNTTLDPRRILEEAKTKFRRLKEAEESGYFEVSLTIIGEPASAESIARMIKNKLTQAKPDAALSIIRSYPASIQGVIRRDLTLPLGRLNGQEVELLITPPNKSSEPVADSGGRPSASTSTPIFPERPTASKYEQSTNK